MRNKIRLMLSLMAAVPLLILVASCVPKEEKPAEPKAQPPAPPPPEPARSALKIMPEASYTLMAMESGKCVQFAGLGNTEGATAEISTCKGSNAQQFKLQALPGGYYKIVNVVSNKCLGADPTTLQDTGSRVFQYTCSDGTNQQWIVADSTGGTLQLVARHNGKALDISEAKTADGTPVIVWPAKVSPNQQFRLEPVPGTYAAAAAVKSAAPAPADATGAGGQAGKAKKTKTTPAKP